MLKQVRKEPNMTQDSLQRKTGRNKSYILKIENGKENMQLSTLFRLFEVGLNRKIGLTSL
ncbi:MULTISPECIES: helix-turn-helix domain-containing protein [Chryseobacterium]|nr:MULTISPECIES: helix-turn-helix transcriptional regulator [Chryseobacterium]MDQ0475670.1 putative transcriptional regulator [Chryseobacterium sp. MDT2-18]